jgi:hypothetical protein
MDITIAEDDHYIARLNHDPIFDERYPHTIDRTNEDFELKPTFNTKQSHN